MQNESAIYKIFSHPFLYETFQKLISKNGSRQKFVEDYLKPFPGMKIIDFGCGPGSIIEYLPDQIEYVGIDKEKNHIDLAVKKYSNRGTFMCTDIDDYSTGKVNYFDMALASGLLHHIDDQSSIKLLETAKIVLKPGGNLVTIDNVYVNNQSFVARYIISKDRGQNIRTLDQYLSIGYSVFSKVEHQIIHDMLKVPYTHIVMTLFK